VRKVIALYILFIAIAHTVVWRKAVIFYPCDFFIYSFPPA